MEEHTPKPVDELMNLIGMDPATPRHVANRKLKGYPPVGTAEDVRAALDQFRVMHVPMGVEFGAFVRGPTPKGFWARLWERIGHWLIRKAGYEQVYP